jgi:molecular chaperone HscB
MNYFELFGLPIGFTVDAQQLRRAYMDIQMNSHPDKFTQASLEEQEHALEKSAIANKAYTLLNNKELILPYVLEVMGYIEKDEKYALSPDFLMEMMELNEAYMDAATDTDNQKVIEQVKNIQNAIYEPVKDILEANSMDLLTQETMLQVKEYYYKKKYLDRILEDFR